MIGVVSKPHEREVVGEFFELFKTPWEFYGPSRQHCEVLLVTDKNIPETDASLIIVYGAARSMFDEYEKCETGIQGVDEYVEWSNLRLPIYGEIATFSNVTHPFLFRKNSGHPIGYETYKGEQRILRVGYDLFKEILFLLTKGQPPKNALIPTLDLHIAMLRNWITETGIGLIEIPPVPSGYRFITCLTHDVDFIGIHRHFLDHSMGGFLYRATLGSGINCIRQKSSLLMFLKNLKAALSLPLVFLGICRDPWDQFDHYLDLEPEQGARSTFFFIPFKNRPGEGFYEKRQKYRAAKYDVTDVSDTIRKLLSHGCEAGVHGIDAWHSVELGKKEIDRVHNAAGQNKIGIRMHWLCLDEFTFRTLDQAGYNYDSSFGYNEAVGFRAGTAQVFRPIGVDHLLELPLHVQDTALFSSERMNASNDRGEQLCDQIIESVTKHRGVLTLLWHQRSLGPERLWGDFYAFLIKKLRKKNVWFATAGDVVDWFRVRRSARFMPNGEINVTFHPEKKTGLPQLVLHKYRSKRHLFKGNSPAEVPFKQNGLAFSEETIEPFIL